jgi:hypothetical protein
VIVAVVFLRQVLGAHGWASGRAAGPAGRAERVSGAFTAKTLAAAKQAYASRHAGLLQHCGSGHGVTRTRSLSKTKQ